MNSAFLHRGEGQRVPASHILALHACRVVAFGIAVAEMAATGSLPILPAQVVRFRPQRFVERLRAHVVDFLGRGTGTKHETFQENLPAPR